MNEILAKRYAKAIFTRKDSEEFLTHLSLLKAAMSVKKTREILDSYEIEREKKLQFLLSLVQNESKAFINFLKIIALNNRFDLIPLITDELLKFKAFKEQSFVAKIYSQKELSKEEMSELEKKLSTKFKVTVKLENDLSKDNGIKISLDELGYEIAFSVQNLKSKMSEYILKTI